MSPDEIKKLQEQGLTRQQIADKTGLSFNQVKYMLSSLKLPSGVQSALSSSGLSIDNAKHGWRVIQHEDGSRDSVFWKLDTQEEPEDIAERIASRMERVTPVQSSPFEHPSDSTIANFIPLFDVHLSMKIGDFGTAKAVERLMQGYTDVMSRLPNAESCLIVNGGDFTHQNDDNNQTPRNKHPLPVDTDYLDTTDIAVDVTINIIDLALQKHKHVTYKALRGNHDEATAFIMRAALKQRYRNEPRVNIVGDDLHFLAEKLGNNAIFALHGDIKKTPKDICMGLMARYKRLYGSVDYCEVHTGHRHHWSAVDYPGMLYEQHRAITPSDKYANDNLYVSPSQIQGITYRLTGGGVMGQLLILLNDQDQFELWYNDVIWCGTLTKEDIDWMKKALKTQEGGDHYTKLKIQPMEYSMANGLDACQHTIVKYVTRFRDKGGKEDLLKARHTIDLLIQMEYEKGL